MSSLRNENGSVRLIRKPQSFSVLENFGSGIRDRKFSLWKQLEFFTAKILFDIEFTIMSRVDSMSQMSGNFAWLDLSLEKP